MESSVKNPQPPHPFWRVVVWARWLLIPYFLAIVVAGSVTVVIAGYGLAHGSAASNATFLLSVGGMILAACVPAASLLSNSRAIWVRVLQIIALVVMVIGLYWFAKMMMYSVIEPSMLSSKHAAVTKLLEIESVLEAPYLLVPGDAATQAGITVTVNIKLPKPVAVDQVGRSLLESLRSVAILRAQAKDSSRASPFEDMRQATATFAGRPLADLPGMKEYAALAYDAVPDSSMKLPAGIYTVTQIFWLNGLRQAVPDLPATNAANSLPCAKVYAADDKQLPYLEGQLKNNIDAPLVVHWGERMSLGGRRGYRYFSREASLKYRYDHAAWQAQLATLPIQSCQVFDDLKAAREAAVKAAQVIRDYDRGTIPMGENPLHQEACAGDVDKITARIGAEKPVNGPWLPRFALSGIISECSVKKPQIEMFKLLMPALKTRMDAGYEADGYCTVLRNLHEYRKLPYLKFMAGSGMALDCENKNLWRMGLRPLPEGGINNYDVSTSDKLLRDGLVRADFAEWLRFLIAQKIDVCAAPMQKYSYDMPPAKGVTLLREIIPHAPLPAIEILLDAGCNSNETVDAVLAQYSDDNALLPASVWWLFRRYRLDGEEATSPVDAQNKALLAKLDKQLAPTIDALEAPFTGTQKFPRNVLLVAQRRITEHRNPNLIAAFANAGARMDTATTNGHSWYIPSLGTRWEEHNSPALNKLSNAQLKQLINPKIIGTDEPGKPQMALEKPTINGVTAPMRTLVCERGVMRCD